MSDQDIKKDSPLNKIKSFFGGVRQQKSKEILFNYQGSLKIEKEGRGPVVSIGGKKEDPVKTVEEIREKVKSKKVDQQSKLYAAEKKEIVPTPELVKPNPQGLSVFARLSSAFKKEPVVESIGPVEKEVENGMLSPKDKWRAPIVLETNLIRDEVTTFFEWSKYLKKLAVYLFACLLLMSGLYGALLYYERSSNKQGEDMVAQIEAVKGSIKDLEEKRKEADSFREKMDVVNKLLENHIYWTKFFAFLEANILPNVSLGEGFSGDSSGKYTLSASTDNFTSLSEQVRVFRENENVDSVSSLSGKLDEVEIKPDKKEKSSENATSSVQAKKEEVIKKDVVNFSIDLQVKKSLFLR